jgi:ribosomal-protein-alanine N-acetyltransferase
MNPQIKETCISSERLAISPIGIKDASFVLELFNTSGWLKYIGDRNIHTVVDAEKFIENAVDNANACIWTIRLKDNTALPIGIITLIKRDYLLYPDLGYALLPDWMNFGFALEATYAMMQEIQTFHHFESLHAITLKENEQSIKLLHKLDFNFEKDLVENAELLQLFTFKL